MEEKVTDHAGLFGAELLNTPKDDKYKQLFWTEDNLKYCNKLFGEGHNNSLYLSLLFNLNPCYVAENIIGIHEDIPYFDYMFTSYESTLVLDEYYEFNDLGLSLALEQFELEASLDESVMSILKRLYTGIFTSAVYEKGVPLLKSWSEWKESHPLAEKDLSGYVYIIKQVGIDNYYKIGRTKDMKERLNNLSTGSPTGYEEVREYWVSDMYKVEEELHSIFKDKNVRGEWFTLSNQDISKADKFLHENN